MSAKVMNVRGNGLAAVELRGRIFRRCKCGEPNPSLVECPSCGTMNFSAHPCRSCAGPGGVPNKPWLSCPSCGAAARTEDLGIITAWYRNPFRRLAQRVREWRRTRRLQRA